MTSRTTSPTSKAWPLMRLRSWRHRRRDRWLTADPSPDFKLKASLEAPRRAVEESRDYLLDKFGEPEPGWLTAAG